MDKELEQQKLDAQLERPLGALGGLLTWNVTYGYQEALLRGMTNGFLNEYDYQQLVHCESLEEAKLNLNDTDYKLAMQTLSQNATVDEMIDRIRSKTVAEYEFLRKESSGALAYFMDFITFEYLIESVQLIISSLIKDADPATLLSKCHPLGRSPFLKTVLTFENQDKQDGLLDLYSTVLIDTPVAPYFAKYFQTESLGGDAMNIQKHYTNGEINVITTMLNKYWLEDFYYYCMQLGGTTAEHMQELLEFEADRRALEITYNSFGKQLAMDVNRSHRQEMFCSFGKLYPEATLGSFAKVGDALSFGQALTPYHEYSELWKQSQDENKPFTQVLLEYQTKICVRAYESQSHFASFYAFLKLKTQEERNLKWILSCISLNRSAKDKNKKWIKIR